LRVRRLRLGKKQPGKVMAMSIATVQRQVVALNRPRKSFNVTFNFWGNASQAPPFLDFKPQGEHKA